MFRLIKPHKHVYSLNAYITGLASLIYVKVGDVFVARDAPVYNGDRYLSVALRPIGVLSDGFGESAVFCRSWNYNHADEV